MSNPIFPGGFFINFGRSIVYGLGVLKTSMEFRLARMGCNKSRALRSPTGLRRKVNDHGTILYLLFLLRICGLLYQVVWLRVAMATFGVTTPLISIVLSVFMFGLAVGGPLGARLTRQGQSQGTNYAIYYGACETFIGLGGLSVDRILRYGEQVVTSIGVGWGSNAYYASSAAWITLSIFPFCAAMGATFPLAMAAIESRPKVELSDLFSYLYLANVVGAMAGALGSAFVLIELVGFAKTLLVAAVINFGIAISAFASSGQACVFRDQERSRREVRSLTESPG